MGHDPAAHSFAALGTTAVVLGEDPLDVAPAVAAVRREVAAMDAAASRFRPDSDLSRVNAAAGTWVSVGARFLDALEVALHAARSTDGVVDPTIGQALRLLGYDADFATVAARGPHPGPALVVRVQRAPGWHAVEVDRPGTRVRIPPGTALDLGATAKAQCADLAAAAAAAEVDAAATAAGRRPGGVLVNLGGDLAVAGPVPDGGWPVLIADRHDADPNGPGPVVSVFSGGLATSSTTVRHWRHGDRPVHHIVDPATGDAAAVVWRTVSVAADRCVGANVAATASIVLGDDAPRWLDALGVPARLVAADGSVRCLGGWPLDEPAEPAVTR